MVADEKIFFPTSRPIRSGIWSLIRNIERKVLDHFFEMESILSRKKERDIFPAESVWKYKEVLLTDQREIQHCLTWSFGL